MKQTSKHWKKYKRRHKENKIKDDKLPKLSNQKCDNSKKQRFS